MVDISLPDAEQLRADDAAVVTAIAECARAEAAVGAHRLAAIATLVARRADGPVPKTSRLALLCSARAIWRSRDCAGPLSCA